MTNRLDRIESAVAMLEEEYHEHLTEMARIAAETALTAVMEHVMPAITASVDYYNALATEDESTARDAWQKAIETFIGQAQG